MLSLVMLASSAALSEAEIDMGESIQGVLAMVDQLERQMAPPPALQNPCDKDLEQFKCQSAQCLLDHSAELLPECAEMLSSFHRETGDARSPDQADLMWGPDHVQQSGKAPVYMVQTDMYDTFTTQGASQQYYDGSYAEWIPVSFFRTPVSSLIVGLFSDGAETFRAYEPIASKAAAPADGPLYATTEVEYNIVLDAPDGTEYSVAARDSLPSGTDPITFLLQSLPQELARMARTAPAQEQVLAVGKANEMNGHPCAEEMQTLCASTQGSPAVVECLKAHFADVSPRCKCALHQLLGSSLESKLQGPSKRLGALEMYTVEEASSMLQADDGMDGRLDHAMGHHGPCILMPVFLLLLVTLVVRTVAMCRRSIRHEEMMVVLPPEPAQISKGVEPLLVSQIRRGYIDAMPPTAIPVSKV